MARIFSSRQVGKLVGADPSSVNRWIDSGKLNAYRTPGGHRRVLFDDLVAFLEQCGMPLPAELLPESKSILLVDDDKSLLRSLPRALRRADKSVEIDTCNSGVEALIKVGASRPDVMILDVYMPGLDGIEVCKRIKAQPETSSVMVLATSGRPTAALEKKLIAAGATAFLSKPLKAAEVLKTIQENAPARGQARA